MIPKSPIVFFGLLLATSSVAAADMLSIQVLDEHDRGIMSRVYYNDGSKSPSFWETDDKGVVVRSHACGNTRTLRARPRDTGSYFDSEEKPCAEPKVALRVLSRKTPLGYAFSSYTVAVKLQDGGDAVVTYRTALEADTADMFTGIATCQVNLKAIVFQQVFKVQDDNWNWVPLKDLSTPLSKVVPGAEQPDNQTVALPFQCNGTEGRIQTLQSDAAKRLSKTFSQKPVLLLSSFEALGIPIELNQQKIENEAIPKTKEEKGQP